MIDFVMPSLGADMDEGTLDQWLVKPGDSVSRGQVVAVVDTTKAAVEVEMLARRDGAGTARAGGRNRRSRNAIGAPAGIG